LADDQVEYVKARVNSAEKLFSILDNLIKFSDIQNENGVPTNAWMDLELTIGKISSEFQARAKKRLRD